MTPPYLSYLTADGAEPTGWHHVSQSNVFDRTGFPLTLLLCSQVSSVTAVSVRAARNEMLRRVRRIQTDKTTIELTSRKRRWEGRETISTVA